MSVFKSIFKSDFLKIALVLVGVYLIVTYIKKETLENVDYSKDSQPAEVSLKPIDEEAQLSAIVSGKDELKAEDLLPKYDDASEFAKQNPVSKLLQEQNFLISGYHVGVNTVMQSNKIPYHDLRSVPPIPKENISPFMNSSYETPVGSNRRKLEIA
uniref:Minor capsid protein P11 C-terminal conserved region domain-containing protein n=1 Tax=viral metagenome TaxID=1070528 RepID=A0A6C0DZQ6_9ZZZZ